MYRSSFSSKTQSSFILSTITEQWKFSYPILHKLSQSYDVTVFYFDNISFRVNVLNHLFLPNESSISQASYHTMVLTICFQLFKKQTKKKKQKKKQIQWSVWWSTSIRHAICISCIVEDELTFFSDWNVLQMFFFNLVERKVRLFTNKQEFLILLHLNFFMQFQNMSEETWSRTAENLIELCFVAFLSIESKKCFILVWIIFPSS